MSTVNNSLWGMSKLMHLLQPVGVIFSSFPFHFYADKLSFFLQYLLLFQNELALKSTGSRKLFGVKYIKTKK